LVASNFEISAIGTIVGNPHHLLELIIWISSVRPKDLEVNTNPVPFKKLIVDV